ncbi:hypothetical protein GGI04_004637 [Coemansia thaxteri]|nr:hypothetical protein GGI04_004637 [Coemansia thaxteri]
MAITLLSQLPALTHTRFKTAGTRVSCDPPSSSADGVGTLYVNEKRLVFFSSDTDSGFSIDYQTIVIHAISRGADDAGAHLYCQLDGPFPECAGHKAANGRQSDSDDDEDQFAEIKFFPEDPQHLDDLFKAMSDCAALNPDANSDGDDSGSDENGYCEEQAGDSESNSEDGHAVQSIGDFDPADFITSADQLDRLTPEGKSLRT